MKTVACLPLCLFLAVVAMAQPTGPIVGPPQPTKTPQQTTNQLCPLTTEAALIFRKAGTRLSQLHAVLDDPDHLAAVDEAHFRMIHAGQAFLSVSNSFPPPVVALYEACGHALINAGFDYHAGNKDGFVNQIEDFIWNFEHLLLAAQIRDCASGATNQAFDEAIYEFQGLLGTAKLAAPSHGLASSLSVINESLILSQSPPADLQAMVDAMLAIVDPEIRGWLSLDDPEVQQELSELVANNQSADMSEWRTAAANDPSGWLEAAYAYGVAERLAMAGDALVHARNALRTTCALDLCSFFGRCSNLCNSHSECEECYLCKFGNGTWGNNPDDLWWYQRSIAVLTRAPRMTPGAGSQVRKAFNGLVRGLQNARPSFWIKVCYGCCETRSCWIFWERLECINHESKWIEVLGPPELGGTWIGPVDSWNQTTKNQLEQRTTQAANNACQNPCN